MSSTPRQKLAWALVVLGGGLIAQRLATLDHDDSDADLVVPRSHAHAGASDVADPVADGDVHAARVTAAGAPGAGRSEDGQGVLQTQRLRARQAAAEAPASAMPLAAALFEPLSWRPAAPKPAASAVAPPPPPVAPPFPYAYIGGMSEAGLRTAYFVRNDRVLPVRMGDTIDQRYRVDQLNEMQMTLTYLPLQQSMTIMLAGRS